MTLVQVVLDVVSCLRLAAFIAGIQISSRRHSSWSTAYRDNHTRLRNPCLGHYTCDVLRDDGVVPLALGYARPLATIAVNQLDGSREGTQR